MIPLTVTCVWVKANVDYGAEYVIKLHAMASRFIARPFRFVCFTDRPEQLPIGLDFVQLETPPKSTFGWWSKVELFNPAHGLTGRVLYLDLDTLIVAPLDPVIDFPAPFALVPPGGTFEGRYGLAVVRRFNSSVMVWDAGTQDHVFTTWTPAVTKRLWGDQDWIGEQCPLAVTMPRAWFPRLSDGWPSIDAKATVVLCKVPKNSIAAKTLPGFAEAWG